MLTREQVIEALRPIDDPEIHRSIVDLDMVRRVEIEGNAVTVEIALTVAGCPLKDFFQKAIPDALYAIGAAHVDLVLGTMTEDERAALGRRLGGAQPGPYTPDTPFTRPGSKTRVIAVSSGKGGVGKSTVTVNLAAALAAAGHSVGLLDADVWGFSIPRMLGLSGKPQVREGRVTPLERHGLKTISVGFFVAEESPVIWRGPMLHKALEQFLSDVEWNEPDFLVVDMPPGTGDVTISMAQFLPETGLLVVTTPQEAAHKVAERAARTTEQTKLKILGVVENMAGFECTGCGHAAQIFGSGGGDGLAERLGVPVMGRIPIDPAIRAGADAGEPFVLGSPESPAGKAFTALAEQVSAWTGAYAAREVFVSIGPRPS